MTCRGRLSAGSHLSGARAPPHAGRPSAAARRHVTIRPAGAASRVRCAAAVRRRLGGRQRRQRGGGVLLPALDPRLRGCRGVKLNARDEAPPALHARRRLVDGAARGEP